MNDPFFYLIQLNVYLITVCLIYQFSFKKTANYSFSRFFLTAGITLSLLIPLVKFDTFLISYEPTLFTSLNQQITLNIDELNKESAVPLSIFYSFYALISFILLIRLLYGFYKILLLKKNCYKTPKYYRIPNSTSALSFFNWVFIGEHIPKEDREQIYKHELIHSKQLHSLDILACHILEIIFWWNPIIYLLKKQFRELHEYEADEKSCTDAPSYIELLLKQNLNAYTLNIIHQFNSKHLKNRIMRIKQKHSKKISSKSLVASLIILGLVFTLNNALSSQESLFDSKIAENLDGLKRLSKLSELSKLSSKNTKGDVKKKAQFPGGQDALIQFMLENIKYPKDTKEEGTVFVKFTVDANGKCKDFEVVKGVNNVLNASALEALKKMPKWEPAEKDGKKVATSLTLPIKYELPKGKG